MLDEGRARHCLAVQRRNKNLRTAPQRPFACSGADLARWVGISIGARRALEAPRLCDVCIAPPLSPQLVTARAPANAAILWPRVAVMC
jgi:hypothetical protein